MALSLALSASVAGFVAAGLRPVRAALPLLREGHLHFSHLMQVRRVFELEEGGGWARGMTPPPPLWLRVGFTPVSAALAPPPAKSPHLGSAPPCTEDRHLPHCCARARPRQHEPARNAEGRPRSRRQCGAGRARARPRRSGRTAQLALTPTAETRREPDGGARGGQGPATLEAHRLGRPAAEAEAQRWRARTRTAARARCLPVARGRLARSPWLRSSRRTYLRIFGSSMAVRPRFGIFRASFVFGLHVAQEKACVPLVCPLVTPTVRLFR